MTGTLQEGDEFAGYRIVRRLGVGGMGEVYLAQHPRLPRQDALKVLAPAFQNDEQFRERFTREADVAATLLHPNIVPLYDRGDHRDRLWISMAYIDGSDAGALAQTFPDRVFAGDLVAEIVSAIADALDHAHDNGLLHRDVKPGNILVTHTRRRRIYLADFGIAKARRRNGTYVDGRLRRESCLLRTGAGGGRPSHRRRRSIPIGLYCF